MIVTLTGAVQLLLRRINQLLGILLIFTGAWVMVFTYMPYKLVMKYNPLLALAWEMDKYENIVLASSLCVTLMLFSWHCYKFYTANPNSVLVRLIRFFSGNYRSAEREGNNVPDFMMYASRKNSGFFFGEKMKTHGLTTEKRFVGKPTDRDGHILVVGGAGSGKSAAIAKNTLETWRMPIFAIDIKGELSAHYAALKKSGKAERNFIVFDPADSAAAGYDPYYLLRTGGAGNVVQNARELALAIIPLPVGVREPFWIQGAQNILTAAILYYFDMGASFSETVTGIQATPVDKLIAEIADSDDLAAKMYITQVRSLKVETLAAIATEMSNKIMVFATDPNVKDAIRDSADADANCFDWSVLKDTNIFLRLPEDKLEQWASLTALMISQLFRTLERRPDAANMTAAEARENPPVLLLIDEAARLGKIDAIKNALATLRSKLVTIALFVQSLGQLDELHGRDARRGIVDNCAYKAILGATDADSQEYFSRLVGSSEIEKESYGKSYDPESGLEVGSSSHWSKYREPILYPHEFAKLKDVVLMTPEGFCRVEKTFAPRLGAQAVSSGDTRPEEPADIERALIEDLNDSFGEIADEETRAARQREHWKKLVCAAQERGLTLADLSTWEILKLSVTKSGWFMSLDKTMSARYYSPSERGYFLLVLAALDFDRLTKENIMRELRHVDKERTNEGDCLELAMKAAGFTSAGCDVAVEIHTIARHEFNGKQAAEYYFYNH